MSHIVPVSFKTNATIPAYRIVTAVTSTANTVKVGVAATDVPLGVSADTVLATGDAIPVIVGGIAKVYFNDTCTTGGLVATNNAGQGVPHVNTTAGSYVIGTLIGPTVAATGTIADVLVQPMFKSIP